MTDTDCAVTIRTCLQPGDLGWLLFMHETVYARQNGYDITFAGDIAASLYRFVRLREGGGSRLWVAEGDGRRAGTVGILPFADGAAELRWILVHPDFRGKGLGRRLLTAAVDYCREYGYRSVRLCRVASDSPALPLYSALGFREVKRENLTLWGREFVGSEYILNLAPGE